MFAYGDTVTILTAVAVLDPYSGEPTRLDWTAPTGVQVVGVGIAPRSSTEPNQDARTAVIVGLTVYLPAGTVVSASDRVRIDTGYYAGRTFMVDGEPGAWRSPFTGWAPGLEVALKAVTG